MEALQAPALPLGHATLNTNYNIGVRCMQPISFEKIMQLLGTHSLDQRLVQGFSIDSRKVAPGNLFFALPGKKNDGTSFLQEVAKRGAVGAIVSNTYTGPNYGLSLLHVSDVVQTLQTLAQIDVAQSNYKVIAITGSLGKTTAKEFLKTLLAPHFRIFASPLSYNSQVTLPLTILQARGDEEYLILEMGMSEPGELEKLVAIAPPYLALITKIALQHSQNFPGGIADICKEKAKIFSSDQTKFALMHHEMAQTELAQCPLTTFSMENPNADLFLQRDGNQVVIHEKRSHAFKLDLPLDAHYHNFLAAYGCARLLGLAPTAIQEGVGALTLPLMRYQKIRKKGRIFINDAYNANPDAMVAALRGLKSATSRRIAVISEMNDLGRFAAEAHLQIAKESVHCADQLFCIGKLCLPIVDYWKKKGKEAEIFESKEALSKRVWEFSQPNDQILLKGARSFALESLLKED